MVVGCAGQNRCGGRGQVWQAQLSVQRAQWRPTHLQPPLRSACLHWMCGSSQGSALGADHTCMCCAGHSRGWQQAALCACKGTNTRCCGKSHVRSCQLPFPPAAWLPSGLPRALRLGVRPLQSMLWIGRTRSCHGLDQQAHCMCAQALCAATLGRLCTHACRARCG